MKVQSSMLYKYEKKWVALTPDRKSVVASSKSLRQLDKKLKEIRQKNVILHYVPPLDGFQSL